MDVLPSSSGSNSLRHLHREFLHSSANDSSSFSSPTSAMSTSTPINSTSTANSGAMPSHFDDDRHITFYEDDDCSNLSSSQQHLLQQHRKVVEDRKREQEMQKLEIQRLDAILKMCEHYASANAFSLTQKSNTNEDGEILDNGETVANATSDEEDDDAGIRTPPSNYATDGAVSSSSEDDLLLSGGSEGNAAKRTICSSSSSSSPDVTKDNGIGGRDSGVDVNAGGPGAKTPLMGSSELVLVASAAAASHTAATSSKAPGGAFSDCDSNASEDEFDEMDSRGHSGGENSSIFNFSDLDGEDEGDYYDDRGDDDVSDHYEDVEDMEPFVRNALNGSMKQLAAHTHYEQQNNSAAKSNSINSADSLSRQFPRLTRSSASPASNNGSSAAPSERPTSPIWKRISQLCLHPPKVTSKDADASKSAKQPVITEAVVLEELDEDARAIAEEIESVRSNDSKSPSSSSSPPPKPKRSHASLKAAKMSEESKAAAAAAAAASEEAASTTKTNAQTTAKSDAIKTTPSSSSHSLNDDVFVTPAPTNKAAASSSSKTNPALPDSPISPSLHLSPSSSSAFRVAASTPANPNCSVVSLGVSNITCIADVHPTGASDETDGAAGKNSSKTTENSAASSDDQLPTATAPSSTAGLPTPPTSPNKTKEQLIDELRQRDAHKRPPRARRSGCHVSNGGGDSDNNESSSSSALTPLSPQSRPLTRYLPVRGGGDGDDDFDLRLHVETSGHPLEACPEVFVDSTTCRGYLTKIGAKFRFCHRRWFVFDRKRRSLTYYKDKSETKRRGGVYFQFIQETYPDHEAMKTSSSTKTSTLSRKTASALSPSSLSSGSSSGASSLSSSSRRQKSIFIVKTTERIFRLCAPTPEAMRIWVDVIFTGAEGYDTYALA